ncbi:MAG: hypothetical protein A2161_18030 [Candidatus Schekmanbacteria bacterium RBG_13_48_7]|uniref:Coenzyme A biosynthesis bifunctional protein CoaBC n=1 Tax=Candidatus Schekmanbacteria bacterium RBG_13_48_7 TaxID=1817878 RepID=A0A1F7RJV6_9BACT|nr:MAG: hypothetical protein A2161_18030 [Candidatus Schekmanbacteria bacterium RBG_13_48_7]
MLNESETLKTLTDREIILGVTGGIAVYKAVEVLRLLIKRGCGVSVVMTPHATEFVRPLTFAALSGRNVIVKMFQNPHDMQIDHIALANRADLMCVVPATANILGKFACGIADDFLSTLFLAITCPVVIAPAMNANMYQNPAVQRNLDTLKKLGMEIVEPGEGDLACKIKGKGRLAEPETIVDFIESLLNKNTLLKDYIILISAGPTQEFLDPVRFLSNPSSGKMGYSIAKTARSMGAHVILVSGPTNLEPPQGVEFHGVRTASEMLDTIKKVIASVTHVIMTAAVACYRPKISSAKKIKKENNSMVVEFERNPDILQTLVPQYPDKIWIGFAAETDNLVENARNKMRRKNLNMIVANEVSADHYPFGAETSKVVIIDKDGKEKMLPEMTKDRIALEILKKLPKI